MSTQTSRRPRDEIRLILVVVVAVLLAGILIYSDYGSRTPAAGGRSSQGQIPGVDVSHYQGDVDWQKVWRAGKRFTFIKATQGAAYIDPKFDANWHLSGAAGLARGAYHYFDPRDDAGQQAEHYLSVIKSRGVDLPPALDVGEFQGESGDAVVAGVQTWVDTVQKATGCTPLIYTDPGFWNQIGSSALSANPLWLADYADQATLPTGWTSWVVWQYSKHGLVDGISGYVDLDRLAATESLDALRCPGAG